MAREIIPANCKNDWYHEHCKYPLWDTAGPSPLNIVGMLKWELRQHFQQPKRLSAGLEEYIWVPRVDDPYSMDEEKTSILIESAELPRREVTGNCPTILIKRGGLQQMQVGIAYNSSNQLTFPDAGYTYHDVYQGQAQVFVNSVNIGTVESIAWEVMLFFSQFVRAINKDYSLLKFFCNNMSEVGIEESAGVEYVVVISIDYAFTNNYTLAVQAPRLKNVDFRMEDD